jgi:hypothetical protein
MVSQDGIPDGNMASNTLVKSPGSKHSTGRSKVLFSIQSLVLWVIKLGLGPHFQRPAIFSLGLDLQLGRIRVFRHAVDDDSVMINCGRECGRRAADGLCASRHDGLVWSWSNISD